MEDYICKISANKIDTGFFCKVKYEDKLTPILITNYHVIDDNYIKNNKQIKIQKKYIKMNQYIYYIFLKEERLLFHMDVV